MIERQAASFTLPPASVISGCRTKPDIMPSPMLHESGIPAMGQEWGDRLAGVRSEGAFLQFELALQYRIHLATLFPIVGLGLLKAITGKAIFIKARKAKLSLSSGFYNI